MEGFNAKDVARFAKKFGGIKDNEYGEEGRRWYGRFTDSPRQVQFYVETFGDLTLFFDIYGHSKRFLQAVAKAAAPSMLIISARENSYYYKFDNWRFADKIYATTNARTSHDMKVICYV